MTEQAKKWTSAAGPRQTSEVQDLLRRLGSLSRSFTEVTGVIGGQEDRFTLTELFGSVHNPRAVELLQEIGERHQWTLTRMNYPTVKAELEKAIPEAAAAMPVIDKRRTPEDEAERQRQFNEARDKANAESRARDEALEKILAKRPSWAAALIIAELDQDQSDPMSDYHGHTTTRRAAIGWRRGKREDFRQLREAAARFPETAHLGPEADADEVEHRENYSMGAGNYLKKGYRDSSGWSVRSVDLASRLLSGYAYDLEDHLPETGSEPALGGYAFKSNLL